MVELRERAVKAEREVKLRALASEHGVSVEGLDFGSFKDETAGVTELLKRKATQNITAKPTSAVSQVNVDAAEKARDAVMGALALNAGFKRSNLQENNPLAGRGIQDIIRGYAEMVGENTRGWSKHDVAYFALGKPERMSRSAANVTSSMFTSFVMLNAVTKITAMGFERGSHNAQYKRIVSNQIVPDFKQFSIGALASGNLINTPEDVALPELTKTDGVYNSTAKTWGGTVSLTLQALVNDDTGAFNRILSQAGALLDKTIDRRTFQKLLMGTSTSEATATWTSNTTSGGSLVYTTADLMAAARGKLGLVRTALQVKLGLDGNPTGNLARFLICGPTREMEAQAICGGSGPGLAAGVAQPAASMEVISSAWLEASALTGNSTTSYYLLCDPEQVTGLVLSKVQGYEGINVEQYDPGAVLAMKWKLWSPFEVDLFNAANSAGTTTIPAAQQGTT
jgi:hypothetical protein